MNTSNKSGILEETQKRIVLGHAEHLKSVTEAFSRAASTYVNEHRKSDEAERFSADLPRNIGKAKEELHRALFGKKVQEEEITVKEKKG